MIKNFPLISNIKIWFKKSKSLVKFGLSIIILISLVPIILLLIEPDFSDPLKVIQKAEELRRKNDLKNFYKYLTKSSQALYKSHDEFIKNSTIPDSILKKSETILIICNEISLPRNDEFRKYRITAIDLKNNKKDTSIYYQTLFKENGKWKLLLLNTLYLKADSLYNKGNFSQAAKSYKNIIALNPFSISARNDLVWCYLRDEDKSEHWQDSTIIQLNYLLKLDSADSEIYNTIGAYFSYIKNDRNAVDNFLLAVKYSNDSSSKANYYANAAQNAKNYNITRAEEYLEKSLEYNSNSIFAWQTYGDLLLNNLDYSRAKEKYKKAIDLLPSYGNENYATIYLYGNYALACKKLGLKNEASNYILKCIRIYPDRNHPIFEKLFF